jgi:hypothetical protein
MVETEEFPIPRERPPTPMARNSLLYFGACANKNAGAKPIKAKHAKTYFFILS